MKRSLEFIWIEEMKIEDAHPFCKWVKVEGRTLKGEI
jgi:hypothetical protein